MKKRGKVKNRLIVILMIMAIVPLLALGFLTYGKTEDVLENNLTLSSKYAIEAVNEQINMYLDNIESEVMIISNDEVFYELADNDNPGVEGETRVRNVLDNIKQSDKDLMFLYLGTKNGDMYMEPNDQLSDGYDPRMRPWYKDAVSNKGKIVWTEPYIDDTTGETVITCTKALEKDGQVIGVVGIDLNLKTLSENVAKKTIGKDGYIYITDKDGIMISHKKKELIGKDDATKLTCWDNIKSNKSDFIRYEFQGADKFAAFTTNEKMGWKIIGALNEDELVSDTAAIKTFILIIIAITLLLAIGVSLMIASGISKPLNSLKKTISQVAAGDLRVKAQTNRNDEFGEIEDAVNDMIENIRDLIKGTQESSKVVLESSMALGTITNETTVAATEVARTIEEIATGANEQAKDTENGVIKINELAEEIDMIGQSTATMKDISNETGSLTVEGLNKVKELTQKSKETYDATVKVNDVVEMVDEKAKNIGMITEAISQIAEQTNLLALNAAIESARAGEHGRGFSVVAEEVRKLAEESSNAANEIRDLIGAIQKESKYAVEAVGKVNEIMKEQDVAVEETNSIFNQMSKSIENLIGRIEDVRENGNAVGANKDAIVNVIENISAASEQTSASTQEVSATTEEQLASMEQVSSHAEDLKELAHKLEDEVNKFKI
ncbi:methyl-accepting chemotaxis protein [Anaeromicrobium sediminis]|uniref:Chemotaxis protein n=1 Tax=Anaeromicrobium sediminis TaxID=1478221 RepID=A0A267MCE5_9FIRM|nr:methyl-accepting chemotaxis protein [Anaeromicrobium sediminis]PAB57251.1 hypothetical protein CCE28_19395 [Anaeromicrobium sediminis]